jgi:hypothetical protein
LQANRCVALFFWREAGAEVVAKRKFKENESRRVYMRRISPIIYMHKLFADKRQVD